MFTRVPDDGTGGTISAGGAVTAKENDAELDTPRESLAVTEIVYVPSAVAVPLSAPPLLSWNLGGNPEPENV